MRFHRRLRRLPRRLPAELSSRRAPGLRPGLSVRLARYPVGVAAAGPRADLLLPRARLCAVLDARSGAVAALRAGAARRGRRDLAGPAHLGRAGNPARRRAAAEAWQDSAKGHYPDAKLRRRAD